VTLGIASQVCPGSPYLRRLFLIIMLLGTFKQIPALALMAELPTGTEVFRMRPFSHSVQENQSLSIGGILRRALKKGDVDSVSVILPSAQLVTLSISQSNVELAVRVIAPGGGVSAEMESAYPGSGDVPVILLTESPGHYTIRLQAIASLPAGGYCEIRADSRDVRPNDRYRVEAQKAYLAGRRLSRQPGPESPVKAVEQYQRALSLWHLADDKYSEAFTHFHIAEAYRTALPDPTSAIDAYNHAIVLQNQVGDSRGEAYSLNGLGYCLANSGDLLGAIESWNRSLLIRQDLNDVTGITSCLTNIGSAYGFLGESNKALDYLNRAVDIRLSIGDTIAAARTRIGIASLYQNLAEHQQALEVYQKSLETLSGSDKGSEAKILNNIGYSYLALGDTDAALDYCRDRSLSIGREAHDAYTEAATLTNVGRAFALAGDFPSAINWLKQSLDLNMRAKSKWGEAWARVYVGFALSNTGQLAEARGHFQSALETFPAVPDRRGEATALEGLGNVSVALGKAPEALASYGRALELARQIKERQIEAHSLYGIARVQLAIGDPRKAADSMDTALSIIEPFRADLISQRLRTTYFASVRDFYDTAIEAEMRLDQVEPRAGHLEKGLELAERSKARVMSEMLLAANIEVGKDADPTLLARARALEQRVEAKADSAALLLSKDPKSQMGQAAEKEWQATLAEYNRVDDQIRASSPRYAAMMHPRQLTIKEIQNRLLGADSALIEYHLGEENSYAWVVTQTGVSAYRLPRRKEIEASARAVYEAVIGRTSSSSQNVFWREAAKLSNVILGPALAGVRSKHFVIVAEGALQYVPFAALPDPRSVNAQAPSRGSKPLMIDCDVVEVPSAVAFDLLRREAGMRTPAQDEIAILANPVFNKDDQRIADRSRQASSSVARRGESTADIGTETSLPALFASEDEARTIMGMASAGDAMLALGFDATRAKARSDLGDFRIIHFATHALIDSSHPERSRIVLSMFDRQGNPQNGLLRLSDVYNLSLHADLVVLSACQTALGKDVKGEGMIGLTRGFMYAGAARVMATLWNVDDDESARFVSLFYEKVLKEHKTPAAALRDAQIETWKKNPSWPPRTWGAFVLFGDWR
jgi:CHAT domain-containing protein/tetratricopeptide (TPR) repeat protein